MSPIHSSHIHLVGITCFREFPIESVLRQGLILSVSKVSIPVISGTHRRMTEERLVLIDTDAGLDDCLAILMAIQAHKNLDMNFRLIGITCVNGNTQVDNVTVNVTRILEVAQLNDQIPVYRGADCSIVKSANLRFNLHGEDGFGDAKLPLIKAKVEDEHGVNAIIRMAHKHRGKLIIVGLGPLTNLALAVRLDPTIKDCFKTIYLMGGMIDSSVTGEFNFVVDPEAAHIVLSSYTCPIVIIPMEAGQHVRQTFVWRIGILGKMKTPEAKLINKIEANALETRWRPTGRWISYDATAISVLIEQSIIREKDVHQCSVELHGNQTRGHLIIDTPSIEEYDNISIVKEIDANLFQKMILWAVGGPFYK